MKKTLVLLLLVFAYTNLSAQTGKDIMQLSVTAMRLDKIDTFKTLSIKAYLYQQGQKTSIRYFSKDYGEGYEVINKSRIELSSMGKETAFVFTEDDIFQVIPKYEEIDKEDAGQLFQIMAWMLPAQDVNMAFKDTSDAIIFTLQEGTSKFNDKNCKKISISSKEKPEEVSQSLFFDEATNWYQGLEFKTSQGIIGLTCSDFKKSKGYVYPTTIKLLSDGKKVLELEIDKLETDIPLEDSLFEKKK
jgi:hypothetical protein